MRLIDADELIKRFSNSKCGETLKTMVDTQPTAYDIDKVVEELEEKSHEVSEYDEMLDDFVSYSVVDRADAIEIVKQQLKEQNNG